MVIHEPSDLETTPVDLPPEIVATLAAFAPLVSDRVWIKAQLLAVGAILDTGSRTVCSVLRIMGLSQERGGVVGIARGSFSLTDVRGVLG